MKCKLKALAVLICAAVGSGCASIPDSTDRTSLTDLTNNAISGWETTPPLIYRTHRQAADLLKPEKLPEAYYQKSVEIELGARVRIEELVQIIQLAGIPVILATEELSEISAFIPKYSGPIGALLDSLATASDLSFAWASGVLVIDKSSPYILRTPQNEEIGKMIVKALESMGATDVEASKEAGLVSFRASHRNRERIESYLDRLAVNTSMINLQLAVMNVTLDEERRRGLDWSSVVIQGGDLGLLVQEAAESVTDAVTDGATQAMTGLAGQLSNSAASVVYKKENISLQGVLNMLSTYGESRTVQNLTLKTLSGVPVELRSGESIPYISELNLNVNEGTTSSGTTTETVETGFDVEVMPFYDAEDRLVTIELNLSMKSLVSWEELSTGGEDGEKLRQPRIQEQSITNIARLEAGETALIGGLVYESVSDNLTSLAGLERLPIGSKAVKSGYNALFFLVRPTVVVYGPRTVNSEVAP